ncbi:hypothetical protein GCM10022240_09530 [Microbacterium kribbense]|uniref:Regulatory protein RecX n=1 Tax=Microbacterium kribbense TaxID=433645 RepID=A0ABP7G8C8_9MICO
MVVWTDDGSAGDEAERLAPVIPLFGATRPAPAPAAPARAAERAVAAHPGAAPEAAPERASEPSRARAPRSAPEPAPSWHSTWDGAGAAGIEEEEDVDAETATAREAAEAALLRKLRTRQLSLSEARSVLISHDLDEAGIQVVLERLRRNGYLDDAGLAEQLVRAAVERKGQGRQVIARTLAQRGIRRDVADAALAELPDDDAERALEFARSKARAMARLDRDTALRRLSSQLARRGYPGSVALSAAREALDELHLRR